MKDTSSKKRSDAQSDENASFDIFPWSDNFATGIDLIDEQHQNLVAILNKLARHCMSASSSDEEVAGIIADLADYAVYHFRSEEEIWHRHFEGHPLLAAHEHSHHDFFVKVQSIQASKGNLEDFVDDLLGFLTHWLAFHILDNDKRMALATLHMDKGKDIETALQCAEKEMTGVLSTLVKSVLEMYGKLSASTIELIRQRIARQRAEAELQESNRQLSEQALSLSEERYQILFEAIPDAVIVIDLPDGRIMDVNSVAANLTGYSIAQLRKMNLLDLLHEKDHGIHTRNLARLAAQAEKGAISERFETVAINIQGQEIDVEISAGGPFKRNGETHLVGVFRDIRERKRYQQALEHVAYYDELTGLLNRNGIKRHLDTLIKASESDLLIIHADLDNFTRMNERLGIETADQLLKSFAKHMLAALPANSRIARLGGDEFLLVIDNPPDKATLRSYVPKLMSALQKPVKFGENTVSLTLCLGVKYHEHKYHSNSEEQLRQVAHALYLAKVHGTSQYHILDQAQEDAERSHHLLLAQIEWGLQKQEFELYFQPKVNMLSGAVIGAEALIRWQHPEKGLIGPGEFIPVTENHPIAMHIDQWVMQEAIHHLSLWQERFPHLELSINISAMSIQNPEFSRQLHALLKKHQEVSAQCLQIEMLENSAMQDMCVAIATLKACRELGVSIAIDDFGTGYSSLSYLRRMPIDWLKLDKSFVANMEKDAGDTAIIRGIIGMGESFGISIIAEGVETLEQGAQLIRMGCLHGQGYAISRPLTAQAFEQWLQNWQQPPLWRDALAEKT